MAGVRFLATVGQSDMRGSIRSLPHDSEPDVEVPRTRFASRDRIVGSRVLGAAVPLDHAPPRVRSGGRRRHVLPGGPDEAGQLARNGDDGLVLADPPDERAVSMVEPGLGPPVELDDRRWDVPLAGPQPGLTLGRYLALWAAWPRTWRMSRLPVLVIRPRCREAPLEYSDGTRPV